MGKSVLANWNKKRVNFIPLLCGEKRHGWTRKYIKRGFFIPALSSLAWKRNVRILKTIRTIKNQNFGVNCCNTKPKRFYVLCPWLKITLSFSNMFQNRYRLPTIYFSCLGVQEMLLLKVESYCYTKESTKVIGV